MKPQVQAALNERDKWYAEGNKLYAECLVPASSPIPRRACGTETRTPHGG